MTSPEPPISKLDLKTKFFCWILYLVVRALLLTYRFKVHQLNFQTQAASHHPQNSFCLALWHEHLFASILAHRHLPVAPLASLSKDGELVTFVMDRLGFRTIRGSSSRRGPEARMDLAEAAQTGLITAITVDGPKGPRHRVKGGVIDVARKTGVAILPVHAAAAQTWVFKKSWDQFKIPKPFSTIHVVYGEPIMIPEETQGLAFGDAKSKVKKALVDLESQWHSVTRHH